MAEQFVGTWKLDSTENFDSFLKEIGVSWASRQTATLAKPTLTITVSGTHVTIKQEASIGSAYVTEFDLDTEWDEKTQDGRQCKSTVKLVDNKLVHSQLGKVNSTLTRYIESDHLVVVCEANTVKAVRKFKRSS